MLAERGVMVRWKSSRGVRRLNESLRAMKTLKSVVEENAGWEGAYSRALTHVTPQNENE
jgi:hypothetical protein